MKNKLFRLRYNKSNFTNNEYWDYDSSDKNNISHWLHFKDREINNNLFGINLKIKMKHEK